jgi:Family of unknown function (DUF5946)
MDSNPPLQLCTCGARLTAMEGPIHRYMLSTPACWEAYGQVLAREYEDPSRWRTHRFSVDAYAAQHPGIDTPQARNSVGVHLSRLCLIFDREWPLERANDAMLAITAKKFNYPWLSPPATPASLNVSDILAAQDAAQHMAAVEAWARAVWNSWRDQQDTVRDWLKILK